ncbi:hypothetical protein [Massilia sp. TS11]|uniref:hypothetical protein n=1 Tax=Massilia sp. TS11 TaxID=2908003 RepID=UPI001EDB0051|nr:hypothetical protein [Massilia sp. TS11]MCG2584722.1 hypothetical protein [Massilia sp. TS11]
MRNYLKQLFGVATCLATWACGPGSTEQARQQALPLYDILQISEHPDAGHWSFDLNAKGQLAYAERDDEGNLFASFWTGNQHLRVARLADQESVARIALNVRGQIAGQGLFGENRFHTFRWDATSGLTELCPLPCADESIATDLNARGEVVGVSRRLDQATPARAVLWQPGRTAEDLHVPGDVFPSLRVNQAGEVAGTSTVPQGFEQAFYWSRARGTILLEPSLSFSIASAINSAGQVAGVLGRGTYRGFRWTPGGALLEFGEQGAIPRALNSQGNIAGTQIGVSAGFFWSYRTGLIDVGKLPGGTYSAAFDLNDRDEIVGEADSSSGSRAVMWTPRTGLLDLNQRLRSPPPGLVLVSARQINAQGVIVAFTNENLLVLLIPV